MEQGAEAGQRAVEYRERRRQQAELAAMTVALRGMWAAFVRAGGKGAMLLTEPPGAPLNGAHGSLMAADVRSVRRRL